ncbi:hypothetical protein ACZ90_52475 [Streptomyces albus subsp. albus]|nr:hypothetical protein ACZ90_52475 [Streptomyces albus subsp. albus]
MSSEPSAHDPCPPRPPSGSFPGHGAGPPGYDGAGTPYAAGQHGGGGSGGQGGWPGGPAGGGPYGGGPPGDGPHDGDDGGGGGSYGGGGPYGGDPSGGGGPYGDDEFGRPGPLAGMAPLAPLPRRLLARIIDGLIIWIPVALVMAVLLGGYDPVDENGKATVVAVIGALTYFVYEGLMLSSSGQTVGKRLMKIRVAMLNDGSVPAGQPGWTRAAVYSLPEIVPCCGFVFWLVNVLWCTWDRPYRQCLHDKAAATVVVTAIP